MRASAASRIVRPRPGPELARWERLSRCLRRLRAGGFASRLRDLATILVPGFSPAGLALMLPGQADGEDDDERTEV